MLRRRLAGPRARPSQTKSCCSSSSTGSRSECPGPILMLFSSNKSPGRYLLLLRLYVAYFPTLHCSLRKDTYGVFSDPVDPEEVTN
jgi:hypothetical protein